MNCYCLVLILNDTLKVYLLRLISVQKFISLTTFILILSVVKKITVINQNQEIGK